MKNSTLLIIGAAIAALMIAKKKTSGTGAMSDMPVTLENIRMGVARGWYTAQLTTVYGKKAVRLSGKQTDGTYTSDVYPVTDEVWQALLADGIKVA